MLAEKKSECGNIVLLVCEIYNESYLLVNVYGPNQDNPAFYDKLSDIISQFEVQYVIVAGDLNFVMVPDLDSANCVHENNVRAKQAFLELTYKYNLTDVWRKLHPSDRNYTWRRQNPLKAGRLDIFFFFVSEDMINSVSDVEIISGYRTDHNATTMSIHTRKQRGSG